MPPKTTRWDDRLQKTKGEEDGEQRLETGDKANFGRRHADTGEGREDEAQEFKAVHELERRTRNSFSERFEFTGVRLLDFTRKAARSMALRESKPLCAP